MPPLRLFYSYSHRDEHYRNELAKHLKLLERKGALTCWHDRRIAPGNEWKGEIDGNLKDADIVLLLVSPDFIASDYCYDVELAHAMQRHNGGRARVIPVIIRPVNWHDAPFGGLQALPLDGQPVSTWKNEDAAWADVEKGIRIVIHEITQSIEACHSIPSEPLKGGTVDSISNAGEGVASKNRAYNPTGTEIREIELTIDTDFDKYTEQDKEQLLNAIASLLKIKDSELKIKKTRRGSVKITLEMPAELASRLNRAVKNGELQHLGVINAKLGRRAPHEDDARLGEPSHGDLEELFSKSYVELKRIAERLVGGGRSEIDPEALIHEAYLRLTNSPQIITQEWDRFIGIAFLTMRRLLIGHTYAHSKRRSGATDPLELAEASTLSEERTGELLALDEALKKLAAINDRQSKVVELRYFGGLSIKETAEALGMSPAEVTYSWRLARAWLKRELSSSGEERTGISES